MFNICITPLERSLVYSNFQLQKCLLALGEVGQEPYGCVYHFVFSIVWILLLL